MIPLRCSKGTERPLCELCGPSSRKRALFEHPASGQKLCARCGVIVHGAAAIAERLRLAQRRPIVVVDVVDEVA